jgi:hypothetical protein
LACSTQKKKSEAEEEKPREHPPLRAYQPDRFSSHVLVILILPHIPEKQRPRPEPNQHSGQPQTKLARPAPYEPSRGMDSELLSYKGTACFRLFAPKALHHCIYPNLSQLPARRQLNAQDTRNYLAHRRCCGTIRVPVSCQAQSQLSRKFDATRFCILHITIEY